MYLPRVAERVLVDLLASSKIIMVIGARQVGKTTLVEHILHGGVSTVSLNLDIEVDQARLTAAARRSPAEAMAFLGHPEFILIDEAQRFPETGRIVKGWYDSGCRAKIVLLGSSSLNLLNQAAESLTGRNEKLFLPPLLFCETLGKTSWYSPTLSGREIQENFSTQIRELCLEAMVFGQYPEAVTSATRERYLFNLVSDYLLKDILHNGLLKTPQVIRQLLQLLAHQCGAEVSINELSNTLGVARATIERYLELLEATWVIFRLPAFSRNPRKEIRKSQKIFFWDTGVRNALLKEFSLNPLRGDIGALFENWLIAEAAKINLLTGSRKNLYFWRSLDQAEVDLVIEEGSVLRAYEIKWHKRRGRRTSFSAAYDCPVTMIHLDNFCESPDFFLPRPS